MTLPETSVDETGASSPKAPLYRPSMVFLAAVTITAAAADLATKWWAKTMLSGADKGKPRHFEVIKDHFDFIYTLNPGGAWSFLRNLPENLRRPFFLFVSSAAIVFIVSVYRRVHRDQWAMRWGLPLALGGAIGNLVDRIRYGSVIDFIDMYTVKGGREMHWPTYNVADIAIVVGVLLMGLDTFLSRRSGGPSEAEKRPHPPAPLVVDPASPSLETAPKD